ncbi:molecular chaperone [Robbsia andropogonis]|uniref:molecular chaperone n=1 Tax=Robbsia andropogonis TaxID=28092 RepID=UPI003D240F78
MSEEQLGAPVENKHAKYLAEIDEYERDAGPWKTKGKRVVKRYNDERSASTEGKSRFNILWSNVQTLLPALYSRDPKPDFQRRFLDADPVGRVSCEILERANSFTLEKNDFSAKMRQCVTDRLLAGRGTLWARYVPHFKASEMLGNEGTQIDDDAEAGEDTEGEPPQDLEYEQVDLDYVHWNDFGHNKARVWQEVYLVWRRCFLTREELRARFPDIADKIPLDHKPDDMKSDQPTEGKAMIYEMWDRRVRKAVWLSKGYPESLLDEKEDPLELENFFPCPRPLTPNMATDSIIPVSDYQQYEDQARELDNLTGRIESLTKAVKVVGVHDASAPGLSRLLGEGVQNQLVPVDAWAAFAEKGGLVGSIVLLPMQEIVQTLLALYDARDKVKAVLYEITGMADILRGASDPSETATAQQIKSNFASIRLTDMQAEVQRFARDAVSIIAEIHANLFEIETLAEISGYPLLTMAEQQVAQRIKQLGGSLPKDIEKASLEPTWEEVTELLRDANVRHYRLDIETDSTIKMDQMQEKTDRMEFVKVIGGFINQVMQVENPVLAPLLGEMMMFAARAFPIGKTLEAALSETIEQLQKQAQAQASQPKPNPQMMKVQADAQAKQAQIQGNLQIQNAKQQGDMQIEQAKIQAQAQADAQDRALQAQLADAQRQAQVATDDNQARLNAEWEMMRSRNEMMMEQWKASADAQLQIALQEMKGKTAVEVAEVSAGATLDAAQIAAANQSSGGE